jgi:hypothetical protein
VRAARAIVRRAVLPIVLRERDWRRAVALVVRRLPALTERMLLRGLVARRAEVVILDRLCIMYLVDWYDSFATKLPHLIYTFKRGEMLPLFSIQ